MLPGHIETRNRLSVATHAGRGGPAGLFGSFLIHATIIGATFFTFVHKLDIPEETPVVPVDLVTIAAKTNVMSAMKVRPREKPVHEETVQPPQPEKSESAPQQQVQAEPPPPLPDVSPEPVPRQPPPPPIEKPRPKPEEKPKKEKFDVDSVLALLDKRAPAARSAQSARTAARDIKGIGAQTAMTADLQDAMLSQIRQCWSPPVGAPHPEELVVEFELFLNPDGSVAQPPQLSVESQSAVSRDSFTRAAAEAARRAIYTCAPYKLPGNRYNDWRDIALTFDPRQMMGQQ